MIPHFKEELPVKRQVYVFTELIKSFDNYSEDIDVALNHRLFVPQLDNNTQLKNLRKKSRKFIEATLAEELGAQLNALGLSGYEVLPKIVDEAVNDGCGYQKEICQRADMIKDKHAPLAESNGFGPESEYTKLIDLLYKKRALDKDVAEKVNEGYAKHKLAEKSYIYVISDGDVEDN